MSEGTPKAIEMKGIVRNATKIGVQDGQAEDLINLRFMDGSWRASGNGRQIENMPTGTIYQQLYVHTNIYHHLLGVDNGTLYWFAEIDNDGVTFYPLDGTSDRSQWPEDKQDLPTEPVALTTVTGSMWVTQTGHLLTIIDEADDFEHFVFKTSTKEYIEVNMDVNGKATDRSLYPFGYVHFNLYSDVNDSTLVHTKTIEELNLLPSPNSTRYLTGIHEISDSNLKSDGFIDKDGETTVKQLYHNTMVELFGKATKANQFTRPFVAALACRLYDGSFLYASNPVLLYPRQVPTSQKHYVKTTLGATPTQEIVDVNNDTDVCTLYGGAHVFYQDARSSASTLVEVGTSCGCILGSEIISSSASRPSGYTNISQKGSYAIHPIQQEHVPVYCNGVSGYYTKSEFGPSPTIRTGGSKYRASVIGSKLCVSTDIAKFLEANKEIFQSLCIFITPQADLWSLESNKTDGRILVHLRSLLEDAAESEYSSKDSSSILTISYAPKKYDKDKVFYQLFHSPMYLLKEYNINQVQELEKSPIVDLTNFTDDNILENIALQKDTLPIEALSRTTYLPKVSYMYNGRLHIANYKSHPFFGYPIDLFHLHNHSVKVQDGAWFPADEAGKRVLPNLADNNDAYLQYPRTQHNFPATYSSAIKYFAYITVDIDTAQGMQRVVRYIEPYEIGSGANGRADFIESLNPLLTYPDARAKKMSIYILKEETTYQGGAMYLYYTQEVDLKPHPYLNMAYHIDPDLKPIEFSVYPVPNNPHALPEMQNTEEYFPNGLKVSKTDQPMFFPVNNTYQVGSAEILALMSNTIAVGTGQTGDAPLYVFCKDGVYALYVDSSGQMAYPNARILARDVCNNPRSVTPIDAGVVFTTDRGLMMIAGEQVQEIGAPAEGDVVQFWNAGSVDYSKIATASMQQIAGLPSNLCSTTDFLTYLQDKGTSGKAAIINYNHNMRELMVSNPNYPYSYVLDREGNWSRRDYTAAQYVNNYPTSYRVDAEGHFYKVDDEGDATTSLEHRKEADNKIFYLSNVIKLDSIGFKQAYRFVVRGYFETMFATQDMITDTIDGRKIIVMGLSIENMGIGEVLWMAYLHIYGMDAWVSVGEHGEVGNILTLEIYDALTLENITKTFRPTGLPGDYITLIKTVNPNRPAIACVVEGSYDGRKFKPLGYNRKSGKFRDIGCIVERTDVRFFRICLSGQVTGKTRIDYMEMSAGASMLNTKIR